MFIATYQFLLLPVHEQLHVDEQEALTARVSECIQCACARASINALYAFT